MVIWSSSIFIFQCKRHHSAYLIKGTHALEFFICVCLLKLYLLDIQFGRLYLAHSWRVQRATARAPFLVSRQPPLPFPFFYSHVPTFFIQSSVHFQCYQTWVLFFVHIVTHKSSTGHLCTSVFCLKYIIKDSKSSVYERASSNSITHKSHLVLGTWNFAIKLLLS